MESASVFREMRHDPQNNDDIICIYTDTPIVSLVGAAKSNGNKLVGSSNINKIARSHSVEIMDNTFNKEHTNI